MRPVVHFDRIDFTDHARRRMVERSISDDVVIAILSAPEVTYVDGGENVAEGIGPGQKPFRVVYTVQDDRSAGLVIGIVTVYRIRKLSIR